MKTKTTPTETEATQQLIAKIRADLSPDQIFRLGEKMLITQEDWDGLNALYKKQYPKESAYRRKQRIDAVKTAKCVKDFKPGQPTCLQDFWKGLDLLEEDKVLEAFKTMLDWPDQFKFADKKGLMEKCLALGWSMERLLEIEGWASRSCKFGSNQYVNDMVLSAGGSLKKVVSWM